MALFLLLYVLNALITRIDSTIYYVNPSASSDGNGLSWNTAFNTLEDALLAASKSVDKLYLLGDQVYIPSKSMDRTKCFFAANGIEIYGGFDGTESNENERSIDAKPSILSGDIGIMNENGDNCYHVLIFSDFLILDNVIIEHGNANYQNSADYFFQTNTLHRYGAGIIHSNLTKSFSLFLNKVVFRNNSAINGGALFLRGQSDDVNVLITDSKFEYNTAIKGEYEGGYGGAIYAMLEMNLTVSNTEFSANSASQRGGAIYQVKHLFFFFSNNFDFDFITENDTIKTYGTLLTIDGCTFGNNAVDGWGGAIFGEDGDSQSGTNTKISSSTFSSNSAGSNGGAIALIDVFLTKSNVNFNGNIPNNEYNDAVTEYTAIDNSLSFDADTALSELYDTFTTFQIDIFPFDDSDFLCFVSPSGTSLNGESWNNAYKTLEGCLEKLKDSGGEIWVRYGYYVPSDIPLWKQRLNKVTALHRSYSLYPSIRIYGGFVGTETNRNERNFKDNPTYFSCQTTNFKQCYQLFQAANDCLIDGFIFINSGQGIMRRRRRRRSLMMAPNSVDTECWDCGGGIFSNNSNIHIANSIFLKLFSENNGGAIYCIGPDKFPFFSNVHFLGNRATKNGGAIYATYECDFVCSHCKFSQNSAKNGGAISVDYLSLAQFKDSATSFISNAALNQGASLFCGYFAKNSGFSFEQQPIFSNDNVQNYQNNIFGFPFSKIALNTILPTTAFPTLSPTPSPVSSLRHNQNQNGKPNIILFVMDDTLPNLEWSQYSANGVDLNGKSIEYGDYSTPNIDDFMRECVIFPRSYCGGPKCSPSRFSLLTGRYATRSEWAIFKTLKTCSGEAGTNVTIQTSKMYANDGIHNLPKILQDNGYYTGQIGKWHLLSTDDNGYSYGCDALANTANEELYTKCKNILYEQGFSFVDAWYHQNIDENPSVYSHNPEWMVSQSQKFINNAVNVEQKPFFLYFSLTLLHDPDIYNALFNFDIFDSPKGILTDDDLPNDTQMMSRSKIWSKATKDYSSTFRVDKLRAGYFWIDDAFGALVDYLKINALYDATMIVFMNDHGMGAKTTLYEQGSRILNFVRYPPLFGDNGPMVMPQSLIVSNVDLTASIFDICDIVPPQSYKSDGVSWLNAVQNELNNEDKNEENKCCNYRYVDMFNGHSIVSEQYQYIYRANVNNIAVDDDVKNLYPHFYATEQLYDLTADPNQQINLISDESLSIIIATFQTLMREYLTDVCPIANGGCLMPDFLYTLSPTSPTSSPTTAAPTAPTSNPITQLPTVQTTATSQIRIINETTVVLEDEGSGGSEKGKKENGVSVTLIIICAVVLILCFVLMIVAFVIFKKRRDKNQAFEHSFSPKTKPKHMMAVPSGSALFDYDNGSIQMSMNENVKKNKKTKHMEAVPSSSAFSLDSNVDTFRSSVKGNHLSLPSTFGDNLNALNGLNEKEDKCAQCGNVAKGKCDEHDGEFYCFECWESWPQ